MQNAIKISTLQCIIFHSTMRCNAQYDVMHDKVWYNAMHDKVRYNAMHDKVWYNAMHDKVRYNAMHDKVRYNAMHDKVTLFTVRYWVIVQNTNCIKSFLMSPVRPFASCCLGWMGETTVTVSITTSLGMGGTGSRSQCLIQSSPFIWASRFCCSISIYHYQCRSWKSLEIPPYIVFKWARGT